MNKKKETWINTGWRPALAWSYVLICLFDFIIGPTIYNVLQFYNPGQDVGMWQAITLQGGGLYHLSMGAIIGISTHGRTQEKMKGADEPSMPATPSFGGGMMSSYSPTPTPSVVPTPSFAPTSSYAQAPTSAATAPAPAFGKFGAAPVQPEQPLL